MEKPYGIREGVLDEHALRVAGEKLLRRSAPIVGEEDRRLLVAEIEDEELSKGAALEPNGLFVDARSLVLAGRDVERHPTPGGRR
jgi:hypothetical protein